jgi:hypothetical protein
LQKSRRLRKLKNVAAEMMMTTTDEIEGAIGALPRHEFFRLYKRLQTLHAELWDQEMADDAKPGGPLDRLAEQALTEDHLGKTMRLP